MTDGIETKGNVQETIINGMNIAEKSNKKEGELFPTGTAGKSRLM